MVLIMNILNGFVLEEAPSGAETNIIINVILMFSTFYVSLLIVRLNDWHHICHQQLRHHLCYHKISPFKGSLSFDAEDSGVAQEPPMGGLVPGFP
jgi:hypothetical protein